MCRPRRRPHNRIRNIVRRQGRDVLIHLPRALLIPAKPHLAEFRLHHPRADVAHPHRRPHQILAQPVVDQLHRRLRPAIHRPARIREVLCRRSQIHHVPASARDHPRHHSARDPQHPLYVGVDHLFPVLGLAFPQLVQPAAQPRVIHQHIDRPPLLRQIRNRRLDSRTILHVQFEVVYCGRTRLAQLSRPRLQPIHAPRRQQQLRTLSRKPPRTSRANPRARARDENHPILQTHLSHASIVKARSR